MKRVLTGVIVVLALAACAVLGHLALIEVGREVITLRTPMPDGTTRG